MTPAAQGGAARARAGWKTGVRILRVSTFPSPALCGEITLIIGRQTCAGVLSAATFLERIARMEIRAAPGRKTREGASSAGFGARPARAQLRRIGARSAGLGQAPRIGARSAGLGQAPQIGRAPQALMARAPGFAWRRQAVEPRHRGRLRQKSGASARNRAPPPGIQQRTSAPCCPSPSSARPASTERIASCSSRRSAAACRPMPPSGSNRGSPSRTDAVSASATTRRSTRPKATRKSSSSSMTTSSSPTSSGSTS